MSHAKFAKKARQVFRKNSASFWGQAIKPKPKWMPKWIYIWLLSLVLKIDK